ncbi:MAG TPA: CSLREA domain-containing protein, partial [Abditibacteriaceae bacterium]
MKQLRFFSCVPALALVFLLANLEMRPAHAVANFVFHEQSRNYVATPTCPDGGTDTDAGRYVENADRSPASGFQVFAPESYSLKGKIEFQFFTDQIRVYYTTDGSNPAGSFGVGSGTTQVVTASYAGTFSSQTQSCGIVDVIAAEIPPQPAGRTVKYIIGAWHSGGGNEIFANSGDCSGCTPCSNSSTGCATVFQYGSIAATLTVNSLADPGDGACDPVGTGDGCTLRDAIQVANNIPGASSINFSPGLNGTIELGEVLPYLIMDISIQGPGANIIKVQRATSAADFRLFTYSNFTTEGPVATISGLTLANGKASGTFPDNAGGAIYNDHGTVTLKACQLSGNAADLGGAIYNNGTGSGAASLIIDDCTLNNNNSTNVGGAILNDGLNGGTANLTLFNSSLSQNSSGSSNGGAIYSSGNAGTANANVQHCTFSDNTASAGGAIYNDGTNSGTATLTIANTLFKSGATGGTLHNGSGSVTSSGYNLSSDGANGLLNHTNDIINTDPLI